jgi:hypothetical protein
VAKERFTEKKTLSTSKFDLVFSKELMKCHLWSISFCGAENLKLQKIVQNCLGNFEMYCWRRMEKISWTDHVKNEVLPTVREERSILPAIK